MPEQIFPVRFCWFKLEGFAWGKHPESALQPTPGSVSRGPGGVVQETRGVRRGGGAGAPPRIGSESCSVLAAGLGQSRMDTPSRWGPAPPRCP